MSKKDVAYVERLDALAEKVTEVLLDEGDPNNWTGGTKRMAELDKAERGDRYWDKKNAGATAGLLTKIHTLIELNKRTNGGKIIKSAADDDAKELAKLVNEAEKAAAKITERVTTVKH